MTTAKHTQGPWWTDTTEQAPHEAKRVSGSIWSSRGLKIADARCGNNRTLTEYEIISNAHLIASAPELLDCLVASLPAMESTAKSYPHGAWPELVVKARAAIAKATVITNA